MKKSITFFVVFLFSLVSNKVVSQTASANANASVKIAAPFTIIKKVDLNFGTIGATISGGMVTIAPDGTVTTNGDVEVIDQSLLTVASFGVFGPADTSFAITLPDWVGLTNGTNPSIALYGMTSNFPDKSGTLDSDGKATLLVGASITINASQNEGIYQGNFEVRVDLN